MKRILYIGHEYHLKTRSTIFIQEILGRNYILETFSIDPNQENLGGLINIDLENYEVIVLLQVDYLASYFLKRNKPTIVIPMYDASGNLNDAHWNAIKRSLVISFSFMVHNKVQSLGLNSIYVKYFPETHKKSKNLEINPERKLKVFFWERLPDSNINESNITELIKNLPIDTLHIHEAHDPGREKLNVCEKNHNFKIIRSKWFDNKQELINIISDSDIYIAPRYSEGIGQGFLEAMSLGCCVIANDDSTHNEYIKNWHNGILVNFYKDSLDDLTTDSQTIRTICRNAFNNANDLRKNWEDFYKEIFIKGLEEYISNFESIDSKESLRPKKVDKFLASEELEKLCKAHIDWKEYYLFLDEIINDDKKELSNFYDRLIINQINNLEKIGKFTEARKILLESSLKYTDKNIYQLILKIFDERLKSN